ncbi:MAG TPA: translation initiation factor IF-2 [Fimbriimonadaceae bacterium]|nr:translation initiation factor IF-2 [Armatimonadota bacterium]HRD30314.1 translation initiation factor IF-2 [Fimbriimonadaceae bacterium]HRE94044.1 translation initiation factor IF-2 [Fimbriimonadaceae bacterium]HRI74926.1 translation initiation factor IF-2 [Fimbriimonadaceae bacterium]
MSEHISISDLAKRLSSNAAAVQAALTELGVEVAGGKASVDDDVIELLRDALSSQDGSTLMLERGRTPHEIGQAMGVADNDVLKHLMLKMKLRTTLTNKLPDDQAEALADGFGFQIQWVEAKVEKKAAPTEKGAPKRPPVVTILGHVDHGKTSLLDYIRRANVAAKEAGGITQHIGAYQVELPEGVITFLDTPGHAAFTAMRARGAQVTDIAILVVAADDGIMPQTIEAISHVKNAGVPIIVAVNKIDKPDANPDRVLQQLMQYELIAEAYGGEIITCNVSAMTGEGVPHLLEMILLQADVMELSADPKGDVKGVVIEAKMERGRGPVATILVEQGTLRVGDIVVAGNTMGKIKAMTDYRGERMKEAGPSMPVEILGLDDVPGAGDKVEQMADEREARDLVTQRVQDQRARELTKPKKKFSLQDLKSLSAQEDVKDLNIIVKADVQGSVEAVRGLLDKLEHPEVRVRVLHAGVGSITESDILLASASDGLVVGFNAKPETKAKSEAERQKVEIRTYSIIYELIEDIEKALKGMLEPKFEEDYHGTVEIRAVFKLTKAGKVAGSHVTDGRIFRNDKVRVKRGEEIVFEGELHSLRNVKQDVREMFAGQDCGIKFQGWEDFAEGDVVEAYDLVKVND